MYLKYIIIFYEKRNYVFKNRNYAFYKKVYTFLQESLLFLYISYCQAFTKLLKNC